MQWLMDLLFVNTRLVIERESASEHRDRLHNLDFAALSAPRPDLATSTHGVHVAVVSLSLCAPAKVTVPSLNGSEKRKPRTARSARMQRWQGVQRRRMYGLRSKSIDGGGLYRERDRARAQ